MGEREEEETAKFTEEEYQNEVLGLHQSLRQRKSPDWYEASTALISYAIEMNHPKSYKEEIYINEGAM